MLESLIKDLTSTALAQKNRAGLSELLGVIAGSIGAKGCILWERAPAGHGEPRYFVLAQWFPCLEPHQVLHDLPRRSVTGDAIETRTTVVIEDVLGDRRVHQTSAFFQAARLTTFVAVPTLSPDSPERSINVYGSGGPFAKKQIGAIEAVAPLVGVLFQMIRDQAAHELLVAVNTCLNKVEVPKRQPATDRIPDLARVVVAELGALVSTTFGCVETSVFLRDTKLSRDEYSLVASTWDRVDRTRCHRAAAAEGPTGWALENRRPIKLFDLAHLDKTGDAAYDKYPGLVWDKAEKIDEALRETLGFDQNDFLPPASFIAVPVIVGQELFGVIRCAGVRQTPHFFSDPDLEVLQLVADQIGRWWKAGLDRWEMEEETTSWRALHQALGQMNRFVHSELKKETPDERAIFEKALEATSAVIPDAEISDIRLRDGENNLVFEAVRGAAWNRGTPEEILARRSRKFPINGDSAGAHVLDIGRPYVIPDTSATGIKYSETFPETKRLICSPIGLDAAPLGVMDLRSTTDTPFPSFAETVMNLLGHQIGLYHDLLAALSQARRAEAEEVQVAERQSLAFQDLAHQLRGPISFAHTQAKAIEDLHLADDIRRRVQAVRGLCGKAKAVTLRTGFFRALEQGEKIRTNLQPLSRGRLVRILIEWAIDSKRFAPPEKHLLFEVDSDSFGSYAGALRVDLDLMEQALSCLLDNAAKYSFADTRITIAGGLTKRGKPKLSVLSVGLRLEPDEVAQCVNRGWQGENAKDVQGEGSGIGLWIVDHIMKAHDGHFVVVPTTTENVTEAMLVFDVP